MNRLIENSAGLGFQLAGLEHFHGPKISHFWDKTSNGFPCAKRHSLVMNVVSKVRNQRIVLISSPSPGPTLNHNNLRNIDQFLHRLMPVYNEMRPTGEISDSRFAYIDA